MKNLVLVLFVAVLVLSSCTKRVTKEYNAVILEVNNTGHLKDPKIGIQYKVKILGEPEHVVMYRYQDIHQIGDTLIYKVIVRN